MKRVFLSYSRKDLEFAEKLAQDLQRAGYDVWYDLSDLEGGDRWAREIQSGIDQCDAFITVISPNSMVSTWVEKEFLYASNAKKNMVPLLYERTKLPIWLLDMHYIDVKGRNYRKNFPFLLAAIEDQEQPVVPPEPARGWAAVPPIWIGGIAAGIVLVLAAVFGIRALSRGAVPTPGEQATTIPTVSFSTFTPAPVLETSIPPTVFPSPTFTPEPATEVPATPTLAPVMTDLKGAEMLLVLAGNFIMGSNRGASNEQLVGFVYLDAYYIDKYEVTNEQYRQCMLERRCKAPNDPSRPPSYLDESLNNHPVVYVDWDMANAYCEWRDARLPTEAEWEKAARGPSLFADLFDYPWGSEFWKNPDEPFLNFCDYKCPAPRHDTTYDDGYPKTAPVHLFEKGISPFGLYNMAGNVREWVADWYDQGYYKVSPKENPPGPSTGIFRVARGGSWADLKDGVRTFTRYALNPAEANSYLGFRCARSTND